MAEFKFKAMTKTGKVISSWMEGASRFDVAARLKENKLIPISIMRRGGKKHAAKRLNKQCNSVDHAALMKIFQEKRAKKRGVLNYFERYARIKPQHIMAFTQSFFLLKKSNFNNIQALVSLIKNTENERFKEILEDILSGVEAGEKISTTMEYYPKVFPYIYINMVKVGELSGSLTNALEQALAYMEQNEKLKKELRTILGPNILSVVSIILMTFFGVLFGVPQLEKIYSISGYPIPELTMAFFNAIKAILRYWYVSLGILATIPYGIYLYRRTPRGRYNIDRFILKIPIFGRLIVRINLLKYFQAMLLNLKNGIRLQESINAGKEVLSNYVLLSIIEASRNNLLLGSSWVEPFENSEIFPGMITDMLKIGMQTDINEMLEKIVESLDQDIKNTISDIIRIMPDVTYAVVGVILIIFVLVVMIPVIDLSMGNFISIE